MGTLSPKCPSPRWGNAARPPDFGQDLAKFFQSLKFDKMAIIRLPAKILGHLNHFRGQN